MAADTVCRVYQFRAAKLPLVTELSLSTNTTVLYQEWEMYSHWRNALPLYVLVED